ncbi:hypothetical protein LZ31DRAFT_205062 [Colletotrichum somersetense]|nr:hypothetical protein LZ31DRAFT_205062 [Colletotrichum somersetense]
MPWYRSLSSASTGPVGLKISIVGYGIGRPPTNKHASAASQSRWGRPSSAKHTMQIFVGQSGHLATTQKTTWSVESAVQSVNPGHRTTGPRIVILGGRSFDTALHPVGTYEGRIAGTHPSRSILLYWSLHQDAPTTRGTGSRRPRCFLHAVVDSVCPITSYIAPTDNVNKQRNCECSSPTHPNARGSAMAGSYISLIGIGQCR